MKGSNLEKKGNLFLPQKGKLKQFAKGHSESGRKNGKGIADARGKGSQHARRRRCTGEKTRIPLKEREW